jgi:hypothetical protein
MKKSIGLFIILLLATGTTFSQNADQLISEMVTAMGGKQAFYNMGNVTYDYEYSDPNGGTNLKGKETYVFDGELSLGDYTEHSLLGANGKVLEGFDGTNAWVKFNGAPSMDEQANGVARFLRKTNYYWFAMFFKLQDQGVNREYIGSKKVEGHDYDLVRITFGDNVGDAQDSYVLYINKRTKLVDQFLFTVIAFGITEPNLMRVRYETVDGIKIASERSYIGSNWDGDIIGEKWATTYWSNIKFKTEIATSLFSK